MTYPEIWSMEKVVRFKHSVQTSIDLLHSFENGLSSNKGHENER